MDLSKPLHVFETLYEITMIQKSISFSCNIKIKLKV